MPVLAGPVSGEDDCERSVLLLINAQSEAGYLVAGDYMTRKQLPGLFIVMSGLYHNFVLDIKRGQGVGGACAGRGLWDFVCVIPIRRAAV